MEGQHWNAEDRRGEARNGREGQQRQGRVSTGQVSHGAQRAGWQRKFLKGFKMAVYEWVRDISKASRAIDCQVAGEEIERIKSENGGSVTKRQLWESQKDSDSVLHDFFTWDNEVAADKYRDCEARDLIRNIKVVYVNDKGEEAKVRAFSSVKGESYPSRVFVQTLSAMESEGTRAEILQQAYDGLVAWRNKWSELCNASEFCKTIDLAIGQMSDFIDRDGRESFDEDQLLGKVVELLRSGPLKPAFVASRLNVTLEEVNGIIDGGIIVRGIGGLQLSGATELKSSNR